MTNCNIFDFKRRTSLLKANEEKQLKSKESVVLWGFLIGTQMNLCKSCTG